MMGPSFKASTPEELRREIVDYIRARAGYLREAGDKEEQFAVRQSYRTGAQTLSAAADALEVAEIHP